MNDLSPLTAGDKKYSFFFICKYDRTNVACETHSVLIQENIILCAGIRPADVFGGGFSWSADEIVMR